MRAGRRPRLTPLTPSGAGKPDTYFEITVLGAGDPPAPVTKKSKTVWNSDKPKYNAAFDFDVPTFSGTKVTMVCYDEDEKKNKGDKDEHVGDAVINLTGTKLTEEWIPIDGNNEQGGEIVTGQVCISTSFQQYTSAKQKAGGIFNSNPKGYEKEARK